MAENLVINGITYPAVNMLSMVNESGNNVVFCPELVKTWDVTFSSNQTTSTILITDSWLADHYNDENLLVLVTPLFDIPQANACVYGGMRANFSIGSVSGNTKRTGYRGYHTANNANTSMVAVTGNLSGGALSDDVGRIGLDSDGALRIFCFSTYPLLAGSYRITAFTH